MHGCLFPHLHLVYMSAKETSSNLAQYKPVGGWRLAVGLLNFSHPSIVTCGRVMDQVSGGGGSTRTSQVPTAALQSVSKRR